MTTDAVTSTPTISSIRKLGQNAKIELNSINQARAECGLKPIQVRIRSCLRCGQKFESIDVWTCGCAKDY